MGGFGVEKGGGEPQERRNGARFVGSADTDFILYFFFIF
jgi:hypothetical protein